jgi:23S rRNA G2069 N7-methylase RlmK/C1962 C5-methylase RlmI
MSDFHGPKVLLDGATAAATSEVADSFSYPGVKTIHAVVKGTGAVTATIIIDVSNNDTDWIENAATITLSGTTSASDGFVMDANWAAIRARLTDISGTEAEASAILSA